MEDYGTLILKKVLNDFENMTKSEYLELCENCKHKEDIHIITNFDEIFERRITQIGTAD